MAANGLSIFSRYLTMHSNSQSLQKQALDENGMLWIGVYRVEHIWHHLVSGSLSALPAKIHFEFAFKSKFKMKFILNY